MADFRKLFPVLAVVGMMFMATSASAQTFSCNGNAGVPPLVRAEGLTELVGDLVLNCTGGTSTPSGGAVPQVNVQIFLNTNVTSRLTSTSATGSAFNDALLMIDDPTAANQRLCLAAVTSGIPTNSGAGTSCALTGTGAVGSIGVPGGIVYNSASPSTVPNTFQGQATGANSIVWLGVPVDPPGSTGTRVIRIVNVRANANQLGVSSTLIPTQIVMFVSATGTSSIPINNPQQTVAFVLTGLTTSVTNLSGRGMLQCVSENRDLATSASSAMQTGAIATVNFSEGFASSFKRRGFAIGASADVAAPVTAQNTPGAIYSTETAFYNPNFSLSNSQASGYAIGLSNNGTRLKAVFNNIPPGVVVYTNAYHVNVSSSLLTSWTGNSIGAADVPTANAVARLVSSENGDFSAAAISGAGTGLCGGGFCGTGGTANLVALPVSNGSATAVWEIMNSNPLAGETVRFPVVFAYVANTSANLPGLGTATVNMGFGNTSTVTVADRASNVPRFADTSVSRVLVPINSCTTNLLFPFLTNQLGFDSGVSIANTSVDPFGTSPQAGTCKINYYGETTGGGAAPAAQTSQVVAAGKLLLFTLSSGGNLGMAATPGFQGYSIAQCGFQYAHGFAYISDVGSTKVSEAYIALILDNGLGFSRTGFTSEILGH